MFFSLVKKGSNVIIRNIAISKVLAANGDAIGVRKFLREPETIQESSEDTGHLRVTQNNNYWNNINSRTPSIGFGTGHVFNSYFNAISDSINTRDGAQVLVESNVFVGSDKPLYSTDSGYDVSVDNDFGSGSNEALAGTLTSVPSSYTKLGHATVKAAVVGTAGNTLSF